MNSIFNFYPDKLGEKLNSSIWRIFLPMPYKALGSYQNQSIGKKPLISQPLWLLLRCPLSKLGLCFSFISLSYFVVYMQFFLPSVIQSFLEAKEHKVFHTFQELRKRRKNIQRNDNRLITKRVTQTTKEKMYFLLYLLTYETYFTKGTLPYPISVFLG